MTYIVSGWMRKRNRERERKRKKLMVIMIMMIIINNSILENLYSLHYYLIYINIYWIIDYYKIYIYIYYIYHHNILWLLCLCYIIYIKNIKQEKLLLLLRWKWMKKHKDKRKSKQSFRYYLFKRIYSIII